MRKLNVSAFIVMCDLPAYPVTTTQNWKHLENLKLADPEFNKPGRIDVLFRVEVLLEVMRQGRRYGPSNSPAAVNTEFGWVLAGNVSHLTETHMVATILLRPWVEMTSCNVSGIWKRSKLYTHLGGTCCTHFDSHHYHDTQGRFVVPLPKRSTTGLGESRSQAVRRFLSFERSLHAKRLFIEVWKVMDEYFTDNHTEEVPSADL